MLSTKKVHPQKISMACTHTHIHTHTHTHTHKHTHTQNKYASNNLLEFHRFLPEDLAFEILHQIIC